MLISCVLSFYVTYYIATHTVVFKNDTIKESTLGIHEMTAQKRIKFVSLFQAEKVIYAHTRLKT